MRTVIRNGRVILGDGGLVNADIVIEDGWVAAVGSAAAVEPALTIDAAGRLVAPGIVDIHGDSFEMQVQPRPGTRFPLDLALGETSRQFAVNGITTAFLAQGCSWEGGLRGTDQATAMVEWRRRALHAAGAAGGVDVRLHIRHEIHNVDAVPMLIGWLQAGDVDLVVFNDHLADYEGRLDNPGYLEFWAGKAGATVPEFCARIRAARAAEDQVAESLHRLVAAAARRGVKVGSHDDESPAAHDRYAAMGATIAEFPLDVPTAAHARRLGHPVVMGAPNVVRGGSSAGNVSALDVVASGNCSALCSDYYLPALLHAAFRVAAELGRPIEAAWPLISAGPAEAAGLDDRGRIAPGLRADLVIVDEAARSGPEVVATLVAGRLVHARADALPVR